MSEPNVPSWILRFFKEKMDRRIIGAVLGDTDQRGLQKDMYYSHILRRRTCVPSIYDVVVSIRVVGYK